MKHQRSPTLVKIGCELGILLLQPGTLPKEDERRMTRVCLVTFILHLTSYHRLSIHARSQPHIAPSTPRKHSVYVCCRQVWSSWPVCRTVVGVMTTGRRRHASKSPSRQAYRIHRWLSWRRLWRSHHSCSTQGLTGSPSAMAQVFASQYQTLRLSLPPCKIRSELGRPTASSTASRQNIRLHVVWFATKLLNETGEVINAVR